MPKFIVIFLVFAVFTACQKEDPIVESGGNGTNTVPTANTINSVSFVFKGQNYHFKNGGNGYENFQLGYTTANTGDSSDFVYTWELYRTDNQGAQIAFGFEDLVNQADYTNNKLGVYQQVFNPGSHPVAGEFISSNSEIGIYFLDDQRDAWFMEAGSTPNEFIIQSSTNHKDANGVLIGQLVKGSFKVHLVNIAGDLDSLSNGSFVMLVNL